LQTDAPSVGVASNLINYTSLRRLRLHLEVFQPLPVARLATLLPSIPSPEFFEVIFWLKFPVIVPMERFHALFDVVDWAKIFNVVSNINGKGVTSIVFEVACTRRPVVDKVISVLRNTLPKSKNIVETYLQV
jgi:hypothetical protein